jgi:GT2 family glycosyltransferase
VAGTIAVTSGAPVHVAVCLVGFRNPGDIAGALAALARSTHADFDVVVCENGGAAHRDALARQVGGALPGGQGVEVLPFDGNSGYAGGNNRCIAARPDAGAWWIVNPDARPAPDAMALLLAALADGRADAVGGTLLGDDGRVQAYGGRWEPRIARAVSIGKGERFDPAAAPEAAALDYILGASLMVTPHFLLVAGPMRDDYFLYGEEVEWCLRARARGLRLGIEPRAVIAHAQGTTTGDGGAFSRRPRLPVYLDQRNKVLILRDTGASMPWLRALGSLAALAARSARHRGWRQFGYGVAGWIDGLRGRRGIPGWLPPSSDA